MKRRGFTLFALLAIAALVFGLTGAAFAAPTATQDVCPEGDGWSDHQDPPLEEVEGADQYCVKGGSNNENPGQGCDGYFVIGSWSEVSDAVANGEACGLSHWGYHLAPPTPTDTPVPPTETPTATSTTPPGDPTATPPPPPEREPKTGPESALPIGAVIGFLSFSGLAIAGLRRIRKG